MRHHFSRRCMLTRMPLFFGGRNCQQLQSLSYKVEANNDGTYYYQLESIVMLAAAIGSYLFNDTNIPLTNRYVANEFCVRDDENYNSNRNMLRRSETMATKPSTNDCDMNISRFSSHQILSTSPKASDPVIPTKQYDFVVVGYGTAGRSAVKTLQKQCPDASIAVIDPFIKASFNNVNGKAGKATKNVKFFPVSRVTEFDPTSKEFLISSDNKQESIPTTSLSECLITYRYAALIATGCRGAPPPTYLIDDKAQSRIYEFRSTIVPQSISAVQQTDQNTDASPNQYNQNNRLIMSQENVRRMVRRQASEGSTIAVLGSGWDAIDLIVTATNHSGRKHNQEPNSLVYGTFGPVSHIVPSYLSVEIAKKLQTKRIAIIDRSLIRYISFVGDRKTKNHSQHHLQVYTAKSYDFLDGKAIPADYVVIAPDVHGSRGSGSIPTPHVPTFLQNDTHNHSSWYHTWSSLTMIDDEDDPTTLLACYKDDGRIAVDSELYACDGVFAAGSVAKYPNTRNGNAMVAGAGVVDGSDAGHVAAMNMSRLQKDRSGGRRSSHLTSQVLVKDPIPIWRSDIRTTSSKDEDHLSSLEDIGIVALCVGNCDSESLATHGIWWTNSAAYRRLLALSEMNGDSIDNGHRKNMKKSFKPIYGFGVIYYLDRNNKIQGVMTWGLPFCQSESNRGLNKHLIQKIKDVLITNGGFRSIDSELDRIEFTQYLQDVSKEIVVSAFLNHKARVGPNHQVERLPRPLNRYTEIRPPNVRVVGLLKRNDGQNLGMLGQDLFTRFEQDDTPDKPIPLPLDANLGSAIGKVQAKYNWDVWEQIEKRWDENEIRARPLKEDPLWIRKGDEGRAMAHRDRLAEAYSKAFSAQ